MLELELKVLKLQQPIGEFFISSIPAAALFSISYADVRRMENEHRDVETYLGIQRPLSRERTKEIQNYVNTFDACFPTAVILAIDGRCTSFNADKGTLTIRPYVPPEGSDEESIPYNKIAKILDGQHRVAGLEHYMGTFEINVTIFIDMDIAQQAQVFGTVNLAQTKVNRSLVYDLAGLAKIASPQKVCHKVAVELDGQPNSPFYHQIKRLGVSTKGRFDETLTQATFVSALLDYITSDPVKDRDKLLRGEKLSSASPKELQQYPLRNLFIEDKEIEIAKIIWAFFDAVRERWPTAWKTREAGTMLYRTNGFKAFMRFFGPAYQALTPEIGQYIPKSKYKEILVKVALNDDDFTTERFAPGGTGELHLFKQLMQDTNLKNHSRI